LVAVLLVLFACEPSHLQDAKDAAKAGKLRNAAELFALVTTEDPDNKIAVTEAHHAMGRFVISVTDNKDPGSVPTEDVDAAMKIANQLEDDAAVRSLWRMKAAQAEKRGAIDEAVQCTRKSYATVAAEKADEAVARLLQRNPKHTPGGEELAQLAAKHPGSVVIGIANASWIAEQGRYADAIAEYDRCTGIENQSIEQAMYIGAQKATLMTYLEIKHSKIKKAKPRTRR